MVPRTGIGPWQLGNQTFLQYRARQKAMWHNQMSAIWRWLIQMFLKFKCCNGLLFQNCCRHLVLSNIFQHRHTHRLHTRPCLFFFFVISNLCSPFCIFSPLFQYLKRGCPRESPIWGPDGTSPSQILKIFAPGVGINPKPSHEVLF